MTVNQVISAVDDYFDELIQYGDLGRPLGSNRFAFDPPGRPGYIYVRVKNGKSTTLTYVLDGGVARIGNLPVKIELDETGRRIVKASALDPTRIEKFLGINPPPIFAGRHTHEIGFGAEDWVDTKRIKWLQARFTSGMTVHVRDGFIQHNGVQRAYAGSDILVTAPPTASKWRWSKIFINPDTLALSVVYGPEVATTTALTSVDLAAITSTGLVPLVGIKVINGQTGQGKEADLVDCRPWLDASGSAFGQKTTIDSPVTVAAGYQAIYARRLRITSRLTIAGTVLITG